MVEFDWSIVMQRMSEATAAMAVGLMQAVWAAFIIVAYYILGWCIAFVLIGLLKSAFASIKLEQKIKELGIQNALLGIKLTDLVYGLLKFYIIVVFLGAAAARVELGIVTEKLIDLANYVPNLMQGLIIIVAALFAADYVAGRIKGVQFARTLGMLIKVFVGYTALVIAMPSILPQADTSILKTAFTLVVSSVAIAVGLGLGIALGWGLKDTVSEVAKKKRKMLENLL